MVEYLWTHPSTPHREQSRRQFHRYHDDDRDRTGRSFCRAVNGHRDDGGGIRAAVHHRPISPMRHRPSRCAVLVVLVVVVVDIGTRAQVEPLDLRALFDE